MMPITTEYIFQRMLALVQAALHETVPDEKRFAGIDEAGWNDLFELLIAQGVMALSLNSAMRLPKEMQPSNILKLRWIAGVEAVEKNYRRCLKVAEELSVCFRNNQIRMLLFKGIALARFYPAPWSREFGDLDIFLCEKSKEGNALLKQIAGNQYTYSKKDVKSVWKRVVIESHNTFLNHHGKRLPHCEDLEMRLMKTLVDAGIMGEKAEPVSDALLFPPPDFDALYVTLHTLSHLHQKIVLRNLCDIFVLFTANKGKIDFSAFRDALSEANLLKPAEILISLTVKYLGLNPEYAPPHEPALSLENRIWNDMLNPELPPLPKGKHSILNVILHRSHSLLSKNWKYKLVFQKRFGMQLFDLIYSYLRYPKKIKKLRRQ